MARDEGYDCMYTYYRPSQCGTSTTVIIKMVQAMDVGYTVDFNYKRVMLPFCLIC